MHGGVCHSTVSRGLSCHFFSKAERSVHYLYGDPDIYWESCPNAKPDLSCDKNQTHHSPQCTLTSQGKPPTSKTISRPCFSTYRNPCLSRQDDSPGESQRSPIGSLSTKKSTFATSTTRYVAAGAGGAQRYSVRTVCKNSRCVRGPTRPHSLTLIVYPSINNAWPKGSPAQHHLFLQGSAQ